MRSLAGWLLPLLLTGCHWLLPLGSGDRASTADRPGGVGDGDHRSGDRSGLEGPLRGDGKAREMAGDGPAGGPVYQWSKRLGGSGEDSAYAVAVDSQGNLHVTGRFTGTVNFGGQDLASAGMQDAFIASYAPSGAHRWSRRFGGALADAGTSVAVGPGDNAFVVGYFRDTDTVGGTTLVSAGGSDLFVAGYDPSGTPLWAKAFGGPLDDGVASGAEGNGVVVDSSGKVYVTGGFMGTANFGKGPMTSAGDNDIILVRLYSDGTFDNLARWGGLGDEAGRGLAVEGGNVYLTGTLTGATDFVCGVKCTAAMQNLLVTSLAFSMACRWSVCFGSPGFDYGHSVAVGAGGTVYVTGTYSQPLAIASSHPNQGGYDMFLARLSSTTGSPVWSRAFGTAGNDAGNAVAVDAAGNAYVAGTFDAGTVDLGGGALPGSGSLDIFVASFENGSGAHRWSRRLGGPGQDRAMGMAVAGGKLHLVGDFAGVVDFGGGGLTSAGLGDAFVLTLQL
jgi:hypothetical protein